MAGIEPTTNGFGDPLRQRIFWIKALTIVALLCLWESLSLSGLFFKGVVPSTFLVAKAVVLELVDAGFYQDLGITMLETSVGFVVGSIIGIACAIVLGTNSYVRKMIEPYIIAIGGTPKIIFLPIAMLLLGTGIGSKVALGALSAFFPVAINTAAGLRQLNPVYARVGRSFRLSSWQMARRVYLPALRASLVTSMRLGFGLAVVGVLLAEIKLSSAGLGFLANDHYSQFRIADLYAVILLIFILAVGINSLMGRLHKH